MAFTSGNDLNILQATDTQNIGAGAGDDTYIVNASSMTSGQTINISDTEGSNIIKIVGGVTIASSIVGENVAQFTLSTGAIINVLGADTFTYEIGGDPFVTGTGTTQAFSSFVTQTLGISSVPTGSDTATTGNSNIQTNEDGTSSAGTSTTTTTIGVGSASADITATGATEIFSLNVAAALATSANTQVVLSDFDSSVDKLQIDLVSANSAISTLDQLNGVESIAVQTNVITNETLINFGVDADGTVVTLSLAGITDPSAVAIDIV